MTNSRVYNSNLDINSTISMLYIGDVSYTIYGINSIGGERSISKDIKYSSDNRQTAVIVSEGVGNSDTLTIKLTNPSSRMLEDLQKAWESETIVRLDFRPKRSGVNRGSTMTGIVNKDTFQNEIGETNTDNFTIVFKGSHNEKYFAEDDDNIQTISST